MTAVVHRLHGEAQHYAWGGYEFIPALMRLDNAAQQPFAEWWMGDHPLAPSFVWVGGQWEELGALIRRDPQYWLGPDALAQFGERLPFLLKILDVRSMLSIQAHPTKAAAEAGFARENALGIPLDAPHRTYRDDNHKPEIMAALTPFWLLHGFRRPADIAVLWAERPGLSELYAQLPHHDLKAMYKTLLEMPQEEVDRWLQPLAQQLLPELQAHRLYKDEPDYWAALAFETYTRDGHYDRGVFSVYLLNLVRLNPGEAIFQAAGVPHAYLEGVNVELMANSDNVFRGGLTPKHINVGELMANLSFDPVQPFIIQASSPEGLEVFPAPIPDFELCRLALAPEISYEWRPRRGPAIGLVLEGELTLSDAAGEGVFRRGESFIAPHKAEFTCQAGPEGVAVYWAALPERERVRE
ncbi:MAG: mannose-6-phosphate isomerase, class I [Saprospiraceae bacterium]|nr:mannose-6-phosphate isomerase, class I [Saprospiraceae bacterium]